MGDPTKDKILEGCIEGLRIVIDKLHQEGAHLPSHLGERPKTGGILLPLLRIHLYIARVMREELGARVSADLLADYEMAYQEGLEQLPDVTETGRETACEGEACRMD